MRKIMLLTCLISILMGFSTRASCLEIYQENHRAPDYQQLGAVVGISSTISGVTVAGGEIALGLSTTSAVGILHPDSALSDLTISKSIKGAASSTVDTLFYGASSTSAAMGIIKDRDYRKQIKLIQASELAPKLISGDIIEMTGMINDTRPLDKRVSVNEVANEIQLANERMEFCLDSENLMTVDQIQKYIGEQL
ncbi:hypothetical protein ABMA70_14220 [Halobacteriovorax sp. XZX-3]|uniref:hypothetical protein n=1 Tax=unclassified Halobacteriovorax TaxID=2639665 RepID=UPI000CD1C2D5|nr:hypothetical protein [Halobacteriovorax sp. DA5]POB13368.1 hypothetical protein C0Z22_09395 [Halobacteriovorax sp. DA5]